MSTWNAGHSWLVRRPKASSASYPRRAVRRLESLESRRLLTAGVAPLGLVANAVPVISQGPAIQGVLVAGFVDDAGGDPLSHYHATIDWGDGSPASAGAIDGVSGSTDVPFLGHIGGGAFYVTGSHTYAADGVYSLTISIADSDGSQTTVDGEAQVGVGLLAKGVPLVSQGLSVDGELVAGFVDGSGADPASNYAATIDWGDGTPATAGTVAGVSGSTDVTLLGHLGGGAFYVTGSHTYFTSGDYTVTVTITDADGSQATATSQARIGTLSPPTLDIHAVPVVQQSTAVDGATVAAFVDTAGADAAANYSATIDWGDGSSASAGTVSGSGSGFVVAGSHTYATTGVYELKVSLADLDGATARVVAHAFIDIPAVSFVVHAFRDVLHRAADDAGLAFWNARLQSGMPPESFAATVSHSPESYATNAIVPAYQNYLGRTPDPGGLAYWTSQMQNGLTDQQLAADLAASPEFYANAGGTDAAWVNALYQIVLGRPADLAGAAFWTGRLSSGAGRADVAAGVTTSAESATQAVRDAYFTYLDRAPSAEELNYWTTQLNHGLTNEDLAAAFVGSPEYVKLHS